MALYAQGKGPHLDSGPWLTTAMVETCLLTREGGLPYKVTFAR